MEVPEQAYRMFRGSARRKGFQKDLDFNTSNFARTFSLNDALFIRPWHFSSSSLTSSPVSWLLSMTLNNNEDYDEIKVILPRYSSARPVRPGLRPACPSLPARSEFQEESTYLWEIKICQIRVRYFKIKWRSMIEVFEVIRLTGKWRCGSLRP